MSKVRPTVLAIAVLEATPGIRYCHDSVDRLLARLDKEVGINISKAEFQEAAPELAEFLAGLGFVMTLKADGSIFFRASDLDADGKVRAPRMWTGTTRQDATAPTQPSATQMRERMARVARINELAARHDPDAVRQALREHLQATSSVHRQ